jgi:drug/metabolite transporter (DMT)-like permease
LKVGGVLRELEERSAGSAAIELALVPWPDPSLQGWLGTLFLGVIASALAFVVYSRALRELDASLVGAYLNLDPIVGVVTAVILLGETLGVWQVVGGVVALAGMWLASVQREAQRPVGREVAEDLPRPRGTRS